MDRCARRAATKQLKFSWIHKVKNFCEFTKMLFSRMTKWPWNPWKFRPTNIKTYTVHQLVFQVQVFIVGLFHFVESYWSQLDYVPTHTHTHTHTYIYMYISLSMVVLNSRDWPGKNGIRNFDASKIHLRVGFTRKNQLNVLVHL